MYDIIGVVKMKSEVFFVHIFLSSIVHEGDINIFDFNAEDICNNSIDTSWVSHMREKDTEEAEEASYLIKPEYGENSFLDIV